MDQPRVQVLEEVHVAGVKAGVVIEIISGRDGERDIRQLHGSVPNTPNKTNPAKEAKTKTVNRKEEEERRREQERRGTQM